MTEGFAGGCLSTFFSEDAPFDFGVGEVPEREEVLFAFRDGVAFWDDGFGRGRSGFKGFEFLLLGFGHPLGTLCFVEFHLDVVDALFEIAIRDRIF